MVVLLRVLHRYKPDINIEEFIVFAMLLLLVQTAAEKLLLSRNIRLQNGYFPNHQQRISMCISIIYIWLKSLFSKYLLVYAMNIAVINCFF